MTHLKRPVAVAVSALLAAPDLQRAIDAYALNFSAPTDDRPFFFHYFKWRQTPEILATLGLTWQPFGGSGYQEIVWIGHLLRAFDAFVLEIVTPEILAADAR